MSSSSKLWRGRLIFRFFVWYEACCLRYPHHWLGDVLKQGFPYRLEPSDDLKAQLREILSYPNALLLSKFDKFLVLCYTIKRLQALFGKSILRILKTKFWTLGVLFCQLKAQHLQNRTSMLRHR